MSTQNRLDKIVIVDDDARIRDLLRRFLSQEGFDVLMAEDSRALARIMQRESVDLIVLDLMLPGEDGLGICRRLRAEGQKNPHHHAHGQGRGCGPHHRSGNRRR